MPEQLLKAVKDLTDAVNKLEQALHEYPKRHEVEERFATKEESRARGLKLLLIGLSVVAMSFVASFIVTMGTVSSCFISSSARAGGAPAACGVLPGYNEAQKENQKLLQQFQELLNRPERNTKRLDRIEKELGLPPFSQ